MWKALDLAFLSTDTPVKGKPAIETLLRDESTCKWAFLIWISPT
jgi:hypothetical protein